VKLSGRVKRTHAHFLLAALALLVARPGLVNNIIGTGLVVVGLVVRMWAAGVLQKGGGLCTVGPYRFVRHPLYLGSFIAAIGFAVMMHRALGWALILPLFILLYAAQMRLEEARLREELGEAYDEYARRVPMVVPRPTAGSPRAPAWQLRRALLNREHYHALMTCALVGLFHLRYYLQLVKQ